MITYPASLVGKTKLDTYNFDANDNPLFGKYSNRFQNVEYQPVLSITLGLPPLSGDEALDLVAFLVQRDNFMLGPPGYVGPTGLGNALVRGADQAGTSINTDNWTDANTQVMRSALWIEINGQINILTAPVITDGSRRASLNLAIPQMISPPDNQPINYSTPQGLWRVTTERRWSIDEIMTYRTSFQITQIFT